MQRNLLPLQVRHRPLQQNILPVRVKRAAQEADWGSQWPQARLLVDGDERFSAIMNRTGNYHLYFKYWCQADPEEVYAYLRDGNPLPNRYA